MSHLLVQESEDRYSPLLTVNGPAEEKLFRSKSAEVELTVEKERVKKMLSEGYPLPFLKHFTYLNTNNCFLCYIAFAKPRIS